LLVVPPVPADGSAVDVAPSVAAQLAVELAREARAYDPPDTSVIVPASPEAAAVNRPTYHVAGGVKDFPRNSQSISLFSR